VTFGFPDVCSQGSMLAMERAVAALPHKPNYVFIDGPVVPATLKDAYPGAVQAVAGGEFKIHW
jgi:hypothetical protein